MKGVHYANFNLTFGEEELPMLEYFEEFIYPSLMKGYKIGKSKELPYYFLNDVKIINDKNSHFLVGNLIMISH